MDEPVLSGDFLEKLVCDCCRKYLSVGPIKIFPNREIRCGRCAKQPNEGVLSPINRIFSKHLFKCINNLDGCRKLVGFGDARHHEKHCIGRQWYCPICLKRLSTFVVPHHFKQEHDFSFLTTNRFGLRWNPDNPYNRIYLYQTVNYLIIITCALRLPDGGKIKLGAGVLAQPSKKIYGKQGFSLKFGDESFETDEKYLHSIKFTKTDDHHLVDVPENLENSAEIIIELKLDLYDDNKNEIYSINSDCCATRMANCFEATSNVLDPLRYLSDTLSEIYHPFYEPVLLSKPEEN